MKDGSRTDVWDPPHCSTIPHLKPQLLFEGKYEILAKIREGGMGTIYRVRHRLLDEIRVVKVMQPHVVADANLKRRFLEEAKTAIRLKHPNICTIYDFAADEGGTAYLVMEYIDGVNLADFLKSRGLPGVPLAMQIGHQALLALGYLHRRGVIHRDVAPDNLMLTHDEEERPVVKLIDLGIAKAVNRDLDMTATGIFLGKPKYASPEQFGSLPAGEKLDGRSDLYSLGVVLYELLTGRRPYRDNSPAELLRSIHFHSLIPFEESDPQGRVRPELRALVLRALQKRREDRFATAEDFGREIVSLLDRYSAPRDLGLTAAMLSTIRATQPAVSDNVTPSAQDRLDRHFGVQPTPPPLAPLLTVVPRPALENGAEPTVRVPLERLKTDTPQSNEEAVPGHTVRVDRTEVYAALRFEPASAAAQETIQVLKREKAPRAQAAATAATGSTPPPPVAADPVGVPVPSTWVRTPPPRSRLVPLSVLVIAVALALLLWHPWAASPPSEERVAAAPTPAAQPAANPTAPAGPSPAPTLVPTVAPTAVPTPTSVTPSATSAPELTQMASAAAVAAQREADEARGRDFAPTTYSRALAKQTAATRLAAQGAEAEAKQFFDEASELYSRAAAAGRPATPDPPLPGKARKPDGPLAAAPQIDPKTAAEARERIVQVVGDYAWARRTRDEKLFARVFPSDMASFKRSLKMFERQEVRLDIRSIDFEGTRAVVSVNEIVIGTPRAGDEVRNESAIILQLEQQGGRWVIVSRR